MKVEIGQRTVVIEMWHRHGVSDYCFIRGEGLRFNFIEDAIAYCVSRDWAYILV